MSIFRPIAFLLLVLLATSARAQTRPVEVPGSKDHPVISRYAGSVLQNTGTENFAQIRIPASAGRSGTNGALAFDKSTTVEGKVSSYFYIEPSGKTALEVFRNYESALEQAGFDKLYGCELAACDQAQIRERFRIDAVRGRKWSRDGDPSSSIDRDVRFVSAKLSRNGTDVYVMVFVAEPNSIWKVPAAVVLVAEPAPVALGQVVVNAEHLSSALAAEGKISLYGLYFDTARADIKPESKPQLDEMARLLTADRNLRVTIVGHTDNEGSTEVNATLSRRRAEAVTAALVSQYQIDPARLRSAGVASWSPVATNRTEAGRARNRRVEMVEQ